MKIILIAAKDKNNGIGFQNELLFSYKEDMKHFISTTKDHIVVMGRKTFESFGSKPLKNRINLVITNNVIEEICKFDFQTLPDNTDLFFNNSIEETVHFLESFYEKDIYVIGGQTIYEQFLPLADELVITFIDDAAENVDAYFPEFGSEWVRQSVKNISDNEGKEVVGTIATFIKRTEHDLHKN